MHCFHRWVLCSVYAEKKTYVCPLSTYCSLSHRISWWSRKKDIVKEYIFRSHKSFFHLFVGLRVYSDRTAMPTINKHVWFLFKWTKWLKPQIKQERMKGKSSQFSQNRLKWSIQVYCKATRHWWTYIYGRFYKKISFFLRNFVLRSPSFHISHSSFFSFAIAISTIAL